MQVCVDTDVVKLDHCVSIEVHNKAVRFRTLTLSDTIVLTKIQHLCSQQIHYQNAWLADHSLNGIMCISVSYAICGQAWYIYEHKQNTSHQIVSRYDVCCLDINSQTCLFQDVQLKQGTTSKHPENSGDGCIFRQQRGKVPMKQTNMSSYTPFVLSVRMLMHNLLHTDAVLLGPSEVFVVMIWECWHTNNSPDTCLLRAIKSALLMYMNCIPVPLAKTSWQSSVKNAMLHTSDELCSYLTSSTWYFVEIRLVNGQSIPHKTVIFTHNV